MQISRDSGNNNNNNTSQGSSEINKTLGFPRSNKTESRIVFIPIQIEEKKNVEIP